MAYPKVSMRFYTPLEGSDVWRAIVTGNDDGVVSVTHWDQVGSAFLVSDTIDAVITAQPELAEDLGWVTP